MNSTRRPSIGWIALLLLAGCTDQRVTTEPQALTDPRKTYYPDTDASGCTSTNCVRSEPIGPWTYEGSSSASHLYWWDGGVAPTSPGSIIDIRWCTQYHNRPETMQCGVPASSYAGFGGAVRPTRKIQLFGKDASGVTRVTVNGYAPEPTVELLSYERPEPVACSGSNCAGPFKIKVRVRDAGWYTQDGISLGVENASGSRWPISDTSPSKTGDVFEWSYPSMFNPGPGSRIVVHYMPWHGFVNGEILHRLPMNSQSPAVELAASPTTVPVGESVTFSATTSGTILEVLGWTWTPSDAGRTPSTIPCAAGVNACTTTVYESGTMQVTARVDGQTRTASAAVTATVSFEVTAQPSRIRAGENVHFTADAGAALMTSIAWRWRPDTAAAAVTQPCPAGLTECDRSVHETGWMVADATIGGEARTDSVCVYVLCDFLNETAPDSLLSDTTVQRIMSDLWSVTNPGDLQQGLEQGGYLIERAGRIELVPYSATRQDLCTISRYENEYEIAESAFRNGQYVGPGTLIAAVHTHPLSSGVYPNVGRCDEISDPYMLVREGPSPADWKHLKKLYSAGREVPGIIIDPANVYFFRYENGSGKTYPLARNTACSIDF